MEAHTETIYVIHDVIHVIMSVYAHAEDRHELFQQERTKVPSIGNPSCSDTFLSYQ